jgi:hypothetical protein
MNSTIEITKRELTPAAVELFDRIQDPELSKMIETVFDLALTPKEGIGETFNENEILALKYTKVVYGLMRAIVEETRQCQYKK